VTGAIVDARRAKQVEGVFGAGYFRLSKQEIQEIEKYSSGIAKTKTAG
jgi:hypothetical protein